MGRVVLLVDDDQNLLNGLRRALSRERYELLTAVGAQPALEILKGVKVDVIVSDERMPGLKGTDLLKIVAREYPETIRIMLSGQASLETAIRAINEGEIYRFLLKPCNEIDLALSIRQALEQKELVCQSRKLLKAVQSQMSFLQSLEKEQPGISTLRRTAEGAVVIPEEDTDLEALCREAEEQLVKTEALLGKK